jgi:hypothetical protein
MTVRYRGAAGPCRTQVSSYPSDRSLVTRPPEGVPRRVGSLQLCEASPDPRPPRCGRALLHGHPVSCTRA